MAIPMDRQLPEGDYSRKFLWISLKIGCLPYAVGQKSAAWLIVGKDDDEILIY